MTNRQRLLIYASLCYARANLDDLNEAFATSESGFAADWFDEDELAELVAVFCSTSPAGSQT